MPQRSPVLRRIAGFVVSWRPEVATFASTRKACSLIDPPHSRACAETDNRRIRLVAQRDRTSRLCRRVEDPVQLVPLDGFKVGQLYPQVIVAVAFVVARDEVPDLLLHGPHCTSAAVSASNSAHEKYQCVA